MHFDNYCSTSIHFFILVLYYGLVLHYFQILTSRGNSNTIYRWTVMIRSHWMDRAQPFRDIFIYILVHILWPFIHNYWRPLVAFDFLSFFLAFDFLSFFLAFLSQLDFFESHPLVTPLALRSALHKPKNPFVLSLGSVVPRVPSPLAGS